MTGRRCILMIVTSHNRIDDDHPTGIWLEEFSVPYLLFRAAEFEVVVASPAGRSAPIDPRSLHQGESREEWVEPVARLQVTTELQDVTADPFAAVFLPGGHGTMFDLPHHPLLKPLLARFASSGKAIAAVCHGPAGLLNVRLENGAELVQGRTLTAFTDAEERAVQLDRLMPFLLESRLRDAGARFVAAQPWQDHVEVDGCLITGQNPQSSASTARAVLELIGC